MSIIAIHCYNLRKKYKKETSYENWYYYEKGSYRSRSICSIWYRNERNSGVGITEVTTTVVGEDNRLVVDVTFKSSSTAGNFVTGRSTDGPGSWKTLDGKRLKDML